MESDHNSNIDPVWQVKEDLADLGFLDPGADLKELKRGTKYSNLEAQSWFVSITSFLNTFILAGWNFLNGWLRGSIQAEVLILMSRCSLLSFLHFLIFFCFGVKVPKTYREVYREIMTADPLVVDLHKQGPYYYEFGRSWLISLSILCDWFPCISDSWSSSLSRKVRRLAEASPTPSKQDSRRFSTRPRFLLKLGIKCNPPVNI